MVRGTSGKLATWLLTATLLSAAPLPAQQPGTSDALDEPVEMLPRYYVEVVVFSNTDGVGGAGESFEPRPDPLVATLDKAPTQDPVSEGPVPVYTDRPEATQQAGVPEPLATSSDESATEVTEEEFRFELLDAADLTLTEARDQLEKLSAYTLLFHGGWVQEGYPEERAKPLDISILDASAPLVGTLTLHKSRFLHMRVDLRYLPTTESVPIRFGDPGWSSPPLGSEGPRYQIDAARRLRSGELHFFDHPAFGVLIQITPEPEPESLELDLELLPEPLPELPTAPEQSG